MLEDRAYKSSTYIKPILTTIVLCLPPDLIQALLVPNSSATNKDKHTPKAPLLQGTRLRDCVEQAVEHYFAQSSGQLPENLHAIVLEVMEVPLIERVLKHTEGNQSQAAKILGLNRATLRKKIQQYGIKLP